MEKYIHEPTDNFNFERVMLKTPFSSGGGGGFSKFLIDGEPFYIKTPKCTTKQGFIKSGKRSYCDLVFSIIDHEDFIRWIENLVSHSQKILLKKSEEWFKDPMGENEIEDATISPFKLYRAGKNYLIRCNAPSLECGSPEIKAYDENSNEISLASINENMNVIALLEIRGIKCSLKSFQFEINIKQIMVVKKINILDTCLLSKVETNEMSSTEHKNDITTDVTIENEKKTEEEMNIDNEEMNIDDNNESENEVMSGPVDEMAEFRIESKNESEIEDDTHKKDDLEEKNNMTELEEINLEDFETDNEELEKPIVLKNPNELYYNMYFEAKKKAKEARLNAITSYLEARNIKMLYDLDDADDSDSEDDFMNFNEEEDNEEEDDDNNNSNTNDKNN